jgi:glyoxylase-like metal-dependent hydrolase (beta-lactamase superfamily II)
MRIQRIAVRETNCYLVQDGDGAVFVDPGPPGGGDIVIRWAVSQGVGPADVRLILVTHGHLDHYGAAAELENWCGAPVAAQRGEPAFSRNRRNALPPAQTVRGSLFRWIYLLASSLFPFAPLEADLLLGGDEDLSSSGIDARTILLPGHSPGSLGVVTGDGDLLAGDLFVNYTVPSQPMYLSDRAAWEASYQHVREMAPRMVYVGHGEPFDGDQLEHIHPARYQLLWWVR